MRSGVKSVDANSENSEWCHGRLRSETHMTDSGKIRYSRVKERNKIMH